ncbi:MAG: hypothetical protein AAB459_00355, partial [Patescibacteria group bacterium]
MNNQKQIDSPEFELPVPVSTASGAEFANAAGIERKHELAIEHQPTHSQAPVDPATSQSSAIDPVLSNPVLTKDA